MICLGVLLIILGLSFYMNWESHSWPTIVMQCSCVHDIMYEHAGHTWDGFRMPHWILDTVCTLRHALMR